jgi:GrpB-like predicted nucleotidyltransferase (UPF0157 family)
LLCGTQAVGGFFAAVGGTVVGNPKDAPRGAIGFYRLDLFEKAVKWLDAGGVLAAAEEPGAMNIPGGGLYPLLGQVPQGAEISELKKILPIELCFEHVGSTSIQGMPAVPTIDIIAGVRRLRELNDEVIESLVAAGWEHRPDIDVMIPNRRFFHKPSGAEHPTSRTYHLHVVEHGSPEWQDPISFRNFLRHHPKFVRKYVKLKRSLVRMEYENPSDYSAKKGEFVAGVLRLAHREKGT